MGKKDIEFPSISKTHHKHMAAIGQLGILSTHKQREHL